MEQGYTSSIKYFKKKKYAVLGCDRGGNYRNKLKFTLEDRKRKSGSRLINCPFELRDKKKQNEFWTLNTSHNHEPSVDMFGHPSCCQLSSEKMIVAIKNDYQEIKARLSSKKIRILHMTVI